MSTTPLDPAFEELMRSADTIDFSSVHRDPRVPLSGGPMPGPRGGGGTTTPRHGNLRGSTPRDPIPESPERESLKLENNDVKLVLRPNTAALLVSGRCGGPHASTGTPRASRCATSASSAAQRPSL